MKENILFKQTDVLQLRQNPFEMIGKSWFLITSGTLTKFNTMTASWGHFGVLWNKQTVVIFVRPTRYTFEFLEQNQIFTLSFFEEKYSNILNYCGIYSGRDIDKIKETKLTPLFGKNESIYFAEAETVIISKKIYTDKLKPENFLDEKIDRHYPSKDYHQIYIGEIIDCLTKK